MTFFLNIFEYLQLKQIWECELIKTIEFPTRTVSSGVLPGIWVKISPPLNGRNYGYTNREIDTVLLVSHEKPEDFYSLKDFPFYVTLYVPSDIDNPLKEIQVDHNMTGHKEVEIYQTRWLALIALNELRKLNGFKD
ncbi:MAG TPA: hypothetical protein VFO76_04800 [Candidatus Kapabacteria bacterium]|nr:hypothetical protein [Candidatus Kapabacteria bacterium]